MVDAQMGDETFRFHACTSGVDGAIYSLLEPQARMPSSQQ
jgi:hypothetical protein